MWNSGEFYRILFLMLVAAAIAAAGACSSGINKTAENLVVVNAPATGKVRRVLVSEGTKVEANTPLFEISVISDVSRRTGNENLQTPAAPNRQAQIRSAEEDLQRASVELARIEPLVASGNAPQAHLDAARAQYQQAQEKLDQLRRQTQTAPPDFKDRQNDGFSNAAPKENIIVVSAPVEGNLRVISVRAGQTVKSGEPVATISEK
jgi:multidrug efflux pump subunit AcrA (membrane-fusion protein)